MFESATSLRDILKGYGRQAIPFTDPANPDRPIVLNTYRPQGHTPERPVIIVQHGMNRNGDDYRDFWIPAADRHNLLIVAPTFPGTAYPGSEAYNNGLILDDAGRVRPRESWVYATPARVVRALQQAGVMTATKARIYGHSAGGQFVHRMLSTQEDFPFEAAVAANAGWYSLPLLEVAFPAGLGRLGFGTADLARLFAYPLQIVAGLDDCSAAADNLPTQPEAIAQGTGRLQRAHTYFARGKREAEALGLPFNWTLTEVPGIAHDGCAMSAVTAALWFEGGLPAAGAVSAGHVA